MRAATRVKCTCVRPRCLARSWFRPVRSGVKAWAPLPRRLPHADVGRRGARGGVGAYAAALRCRGALTGTVLRRRRKPPPRPRCHPPPRRRRRPATRHGTASAWRGGQRWRKRRSCSLARHPQERLRQCRRCERCCSSFRSSSGRATCLMPRCCAGCARASSAWTSRACGWLSAARTVPSSAPHSRARAEAPRPHRPATQLRAAACSAAVRAEASRRAARRAVALRCF